jgi:hypothetical protein
MQIGIVEQIVTVQLLSMMMLSKRRRKRRRRIAPRACSVDAADWPCRRQRPKAVGHSHRGRLVDALRQGARGKREIFQFNDK